MRLRSKLIGLALAGATALAVPACAPTGGYVVATLEQPPPPARAERPIYRPGFVWVQGRWVHDNAGRWRWQNGYYMRERPGYVFVPGHWLRQGRTYTWIDGRWMPRGSVVIRGQARW